MMYTNTLIHTLNYIGFLVSGIYNDYGRLSSLIINHIHYGGFGSSSDNSTYIVYQCLSTAIT